MGKKLGLKIKQLRSNYSFNIGTKITQKDLANKLGISRSYLGDIESGRTPASEEILHKLSEIFDINYSELLQLKNDDQLEQMDNGNSNEDIDDGLAIIELARKKMSEKEKEKMMNMLKIAFDEYFND